MPTKPIDPPPNGQHWIRLTDMADVLGTHEQGVRDVHAAMGRPFERLLSTRGRPVEVDAPRWLRAWRWWFVANRKQID